MGSWFFRFIKLRHDRWALSLLFMTLFTLPAQARVFDFSQESFSPFLNIRGGQSAMGQSPYNWQNVDQIGGGKASFLYGGEFGLRWHGSQIAFSIGALVQSLGPATGVIASSGGDDLFQAEGDGFAYGPTLQFDYYFSQTEHHRWSLFLGGGYQFTRIDNSYTLTPAGQALWGLPQEVSETYRNTLPHLTVGVGTEMWLSKTTTVSLQLGYHYALNSTWSHSGGGENMAGVYSPGDPVVFEDSSNKNINWSYVFLQLGLQFYVDTLR